MPRRFRARSSSIATSSKMRAGSAARKPPRCCCGSIREGLTTPPPVAIAHHIIRAWVEDGDRCLRLNAARATADPLRRHRGHRSRLSASTRFPQSGTKNARQRFHDPRSAAAPPTPRSPLRGSADARVLPRRSAARRARPHRRRDPGESSNSENVDHSGVVRVAGVPCLRSPRSSSIASASG